jgi:tetraacyldisaccharide 4'-kinase
VRIALEAFLMRSWLKRGWFAYLMWPLSVVFSLLLKQRYRAIALGHRPVTKLHVPVVVVGNIFIGGTGKTPLVIYLVQALKKAGYHPGVVSRGYAASEIAKGDGTSAEARQVTSNSLASEVGDEPCLIFAQTGVPVWVGRKRGACGEALLHAAPETNVIICDDGLQHDALARDVEIVLFDERGIGNGFLLPAGPLRESPLRRRDFTVINTNLNLAATSPSKFSQLGNNLIQMRLVAGLAYALSSPEKTRDLQAFKNNKICAAAGIGNPQRFFNMLKDVNLVFQERALNDHFAFTEETFLNLDAEIILITEKDAVKCRQISALCLDQRIWVVPVEAKFEPDFTQQLLARLSEK